MRSWLSLLLLVLVALVLPWDAVRHAREMERQLRHSEQRHLSRLARTLAASLQGRARLIYRYPAETLDPGPDTLIPVPLRAPIAFADYPVGWPQIRPWRRYGTGTRHFDILTGVDGRMLYVALRVTDPHPVFGTPLANPLGPAAIGDLVWIGFGGPLGRAHAEFLPLEGAGPLMARRIVIGAYGRQQPIPDPRIVGNLQLEPFGYAVEFAMPLAMIGGPFGILIEDRDRRETPPRFFGMLDPRTLRARGGLIVASAALPAYLHRLLRPGLRLVVTTTDGAPLAQALAPIVPGIPAPHASMLTLLFQRLADAGHDAPISAGAPIRGPSGRGIIAGLEVTQTSARWAHGPDQTLQQLLDLILAASLIAFLGAIVLAVRIVRQARRPAAGGATAQRVCDTHQTCGRFRLHRAVFSRTIRAAPRGVVPPATSNDGGLDPLEV